MRLDLTARVVDHLPIDTSPRYPPPLPLLSGHGQDGSSSGDDDRYRRVYGLLVDAEEVLRGLASGNATTVVRLADRALQELATLT